MPKQAAQPWTVIDTLENVVVDSGPFFTQGEALDAANIWNRRHNHGHPVKTMRYTPSNTYPAKDGATIETPLYTVGIVDGLNHGAALEELQNILWDRLGDIQVLGPDGKPCLVTVSLTVEPEAVWRAGAIDGIIRRTEA